MSTNYWNFKSTQEALAESIAATQDIKDVGNPLKLKWKNKSPQKRANQVYKMLGSPNMIWKDAGGSIVWKRADPYFSTANVAEDESDQVYLKIEIKDEMIPHLVPGPHNDWMYATIWLNIPSDRLASVLALSESVFYDRLTKELTVRCHFMAANIATLYLAKQIALGEKDPNIAKQEYGVLISLLGKEQKEGSGLGSESTGVWHENLTGYIFDL